jgi:hypothetical protein
MSWLGLLLVIVGIWLAIKVVGVLLRIGLVLLVVFGLYLLLGPHLGLPALW